MSAETVVAIKRSFVSLLEERALKSITVRDIVEGCGLNRNTFYYHFKDIPSMIEEIIEETAAGIISEHNALSSLEDCLKVAVQFAVKNKKAILNLHRSSNREVYEGYVMRISEHLVKQYICSTNASELLDEDEKRLVVIAYKCVLFGFIIDWLDGGMKRDVLSEFSSYIKLRHRLYGTMMM
ncbi:MAG: TetR/AcrR family transcriptional regulator [Ruminococcus sp.]|nr:TetR/AcrR family transcriptional regulator [Ruminococcus sp.]